MYLLLIILFFTPEILAKKCKYDFDAGIEFPKEVHFPNRWGKCDQYGHLPGLALDFKLLNAKVDNLLANIGGCHSDAFAYLFLPKPEATTVPETTADSTAEPTTVSSVAGESSTSTTSAPASSGATATGSSSAQQSVDEPLVLEWEGFKLDAPKSFYIAECRRTYSKLACSQKEREKRIIDVKALAEAKKLGIKIVLPPKVPKVHADYAINFEEMFKETKSLIVQQLEDGKKDLEAKNKANSAQADFEAEKKRIAEEQAAAIAKAKADAEKAGLTAEQQAAAIKAAEEKAAADALKAQQEAEKKRQEELAAANAASKFKKGVCKNGAGVELGPCLTLDSGRCLYRFKAAPGDITQCEGVCTDFWKPLTGNFQNGEGVSCKIGAAQRSDMAKPQVSCDSEFLYTSPDDDGAAPFTCKGKGDTGFFFVPK